MSEVRPTRVFRTEGSGASGLRHARRSSSSTGKKSIGVALCAASFGLVAACGANGEGKAPPDDTAPNTSADTSVTATTTAPKDADPVAINPNLCAVIPPEVTAAVLKITVDSSELQTGLDSCVGSDGVPTPNSQHLIASSHLMTSPNTGVYTSIYTEAQVPELLEAAEERNLPKLNTVPLTVNDKEGVFLPTLGLAEVPFKNGPQELYLNVNAGFDVSTADIATYIAQVEAAILNPQAGHQ